MTRLERAIADNALSGGDIAVLTHLAILPGSADVGVTASDIAPHTIFSHAWLDEKLASLAERGLIARHPENAARFLIAGDA